MTITSYAGQIVQIPDDAFAEGDPIAAAYAFMARNNLAHLIDCAPQPRIGWSQIPLIPSNNYVRFAMNAWPTNGVVCGYSQEFALSWLSDVRPANLYAFALALADSNSGDSTYDYRMVVVPAHTPVGQGNDLAVVDVSGTQTLGSPALIGGGFYDMSEHLDTLRGAFVGVGIADDGDAFREQSMCLLRFEVQITFESVANEDLNECYVNAALVWEYS